MKMSSLTTSLYNQLLSSHLQIAGIAAVLLTVCLAMISYFQHGSTTIADVRLPSSIMSGHIMNEIETSNSYLRSWVLLGGKNRVDNRRKIWREQIEPTVDKLEAHSDENNSSLSIVSLRTRMERLKESQWWVEEIAATVGNKPARLIYERDLLPIYRRIEQAMTGISNITTDEYPSGKQSNIDEIRLSAAVTHQRLSEAIRQLSEAVRTGSSTEIKDFYEGSKNVEVMLTQLKDKIDPGGDTRPLLAWILREYTVYEQLAARIISTRQSDDWNRALKILRTETEPLADDINIFLTDLQEEHNNLLNKDITQNALISRVGAFVTVFMIFSLGIISWLFAKSKSHQIIAPIEALSEASDHLADSKSRPIQLEVTGPIEIAHLTRRFNYMSCELITKANALKQTNKDLQEYAHIITHDLKPPLINIKGHANLLKQHLQKLQDIANNPEESEQQIRESVIKTISVDVQDAIHYIDHSISKTSTLVSGVLDNSKLVSRALELEEVDMNQLVKQVIDTFSHNFNEVDFICTDLPALHTDSFFMEHAFSNLIDNALKHLDKGRRGKITISGKLNRFEAQFFIQDNGTGIDNKHIDVFRLFSQADNDSEGTGIGLALVKTMLTKLNGSITHRNNNDYGVTFIINHPIIGKV
jgi:signal transduction histidine kinase